VERFVELFEQFPMLRLETIFLNAIAALWLMGVAKGFDSWPKIEGSGDRLIIGVPSRRVSLNKLKFIIVSETISLKPSLSSNVSYCEGSFNEITSR